MKYSILLLPLTLILLSSCQKNVTGYEGDLFLPQQFTTECYEEYKDHKYTQLEERSFKLLENGDLERKGPNGEKAVFKNKSSISMLADENEGFCILWLAEDESNEEPVTIYLFESSLLMIYDAGEAAHYRQTCSPGEELGSVGKSLLIKAGVIDALSARR